MTADVIVLGPRDRDVKTPKGVEIISTVSKTAYWSQLSPFLLGPCKLWGGHVSQTMENAWQYSKVYSRHKNHMYAETGLPTQSWLKWAKAGWANPRAVRYPMGKGAVPEYSFWDGEQLGYVEARARIYVPLYARLVKKTKAFKKLKLMYEYGDQIYLWDYDGYDRRKTGATLLDVLTNPRKKMGHGFVLAMMLEWGEDFYRV